MRIIEFICCLLLLAGCVRTESAQSHKPQKQEQFLIDSLISVMSLEEKAGQLTLYTSGWDVTGPSLNDNYKNELKAGHVGGLFNAHTVKYNRELQRIAVEETRLGIPLIFGYDVIHGYKTIFPIPLAEAASWDLDIIRKSARLSAKEAAAAGLNWTYNPMVDISRDPRWGRVAEGSGEDPYLDSRIAEAKVHGIQGDDLSDPLTLLACVKHFAAYGAPKGGRDYHTVDMSERQLRQDYLPPYKAAIDAGAGTVMSSFNEIDGIPATGNKVLLTDILRDEWNFDGFVVTDYTSINEMVPHGIVTDQKEAAALAINAGVDMDMQSGAFSKYIPELVKDGMVSEETVNQAVRRILEKKVELGLFDDPYRYLDEEREKNIVESKEMMDHALVAARSSIVLLKNAPFKGNKLLPLTKNAGSIALIGPLADDRIDLLGSWHASGDDTSVITLKTALEEGYPGVKINYSKGCDFTDSVITGFQGAIAAANSSDIVIMALGENYQESGEAASRSDIGLPGSQQELLKKVVATGKPVIVLVMAGRPLTLAWMNDHVSAIVNTWHLGTMAGPAIIQVLKGTYNPSGKLPMTFPRSVGQIPIHYAMKNTGRPFDDANKYTSKYLDIPNTPLYPFGFGLSYTTFDYSDLTLSSTVMNLNDSLIASVTVTNTGEVQGQEVVQLYIRDLVGSVTRPVKELKGFRKIKLEPGESKKIDFSISSGDLAFYTRDMTWKAEPGKFDVFIGTDSNTENKNSFMLKSEK